MPQVGYEPTISAGERSQIYALDRAATGTGTSVYTLVILRICKITSVYRLVILPIFLNFSMTHHFRMYSEKLLIIDRGTVRNM